MNRGLMGLNVAGVISLVAIGVVAVSYITAYNFGNRMEQQIKAAWEDNEGILAQYGQKVQEAAKVTELQRDDLKDVFTGAIEARYGKQGSQAVFQWIQEQNPNLDSTVYKQVQQIVEAGRNEFRVGQTRLVDIKQIYRTGLGKFWRGYWLEVAGYPRIAVGFPDVAKDDYKVITTDLASGAFKSGKESGPIKLR